MPSKVKHLRIVGLNDTDVRVLCLDPRVEVGARTKPPHKENSLIMLSKQNSRRIRQRLMLTVISLPLGCWSMIRFKRA